MTTVKNNRSGGGGGGGLVVLHLVQTPKLPLESRSNDNFSGGKGGVESYLLSVSVLPSQVT